MIQVNSITLHVVVKNVNFLSYLADGRHKVVAVHNGGRCRSAKITARSACAADFNHKRPGTAGNFRKDLLKAVF